MTHLDAVLYYCDKNEIEVESVSKLITKDLKDKIETNARELRLLNDDVGVGQTTSMNILVTGSDGFY